MKLISESYKRRLQELAGVSLLKESDYFKVRGETFQLFDEDALPFFFYNGKLYTGGFEESHWDIWVGREEYDKIFEPLIKDGKSDDDAHELTKEYIMENADYNGRLFKNRKVIAFWRFPSKEKLVDIVSLLNKKLSDKNIKIDGSWRIYTQNQDGEDDLINLSDYTNGSIPDEFKEKQIEKHKIHMLSPLEKTKLGLDKKPEGFGSKNQLYPYYRELERIRGGAEE